MSTPAIGVVGAGYVGLVTGVGLSTLGHTVRIADRDTDRIDRLRQGVPPIFEPGLEPAIRAGLEHGRLSFDVSNETTASVSNVLYLAVPTPMADNGSADLEAIVSVVDEVLPALPELACIVIKSTVPPGTARSLEDRVKEVRGDVHVVSNPEFLTQGRALENFLHPHRIVVGSPTPEAARRVAGLYTSIDAPVLITSPTTAEMVKYASNTFLATKVSFINSIARLCDSVGASVDDVVEGLGLEPRIGRAFLKPGPGFGGSCLPKDTAALAHLAQEVGLKPSLLNAVLEENAMQLDYLEERIRGLVEESRTIGVWGLTFKAGTDDLRDSPAVALVQRLIADGYDVATFDPMAPRTSHLGRRVSSAEEAARDAAVLVVLTEWPEFAAADFERVAQVMSGRFVVDGRNVLDQLTVEEAGLVYSAVGRSALEPR